MQNVSQNYLNIINDINNIGRNMRNKVVIDNVEYLSDVIKSSTNEIKSFIHPKDDKTVMYHQIKPVNALAVNLDVGSSAEGNLRVPELKALQLV
mgnify:CR=1 FL=1